MIILRVFVPFAFAYLLSYLFRVVNAVIAPDMVRDLCLGAADLGLLTSAYFLAFAAFQLPLGILLDRYGPRRVEAVLLLFAASGAFVFAFAETINGLIAGRALIGFGVSACLMAALKAYVIWVPSERLPLINGFQLSAGGLGVLMATVPVEAALHVTDWRGIFIVLGFLTLAAAATLFMVVPEREGSHSGDSLINQIRGIGHVYSSPLFWRIVPLTVATQAAFMAIQSLWAGPWLRDIGGLERAAVANHLFMMAVAMMAGHIALGALAERLGRLGIKPITIGAVGMGVFILIQIAIVTGWTGAVLPMWMIFSVLGSAGILTYAGLSQSFPPALVGRVITALNVLVFAFTFLAQWIIGVIIDQWPPTAAGGYAEEGYQTGLGLVLAVQAIALLWYVVAPGGRTASAR